MQRSRTGTKAQTKRNECCDLGEQQQGARKPGSRVRPPFPALDFYRSKDATSIPMSRHCSSPGLMSQGGHWGRDMTLMSSRGEAGDAACGHLCPPPRLNASTPPPHLCNNFSALLGRALHTAGVCARQFAWRLSEMGRSRFPMFRTRSRCGKQRFH